MDATTAPTDALTGPDDGVSFAFPKFDAIARPAATRAPTHGQSTRRNSMALPSLAFDFPAQVNEHAARLVGTVVASTLLVAAVTGAWWLVPVLAVGFVLRVGWGPKFSPLAKVAMFVAKKLWTPKPVSGAPKRFAQGIGAACTVSATALFLAGLSTAAWVIVGMVAVFAFLEASIAFCMGCWIYARLQSVGVFPADACVDCAPEGSKLRGALGN